MTPNPYFNASDTNAAARFKVANTTMYEDNADAVFVGYTGDAAKDILFP